MRSWRSWTLVFCWLLLTASPLIAAEPFRILQIYSNNRLLPANLAVDAGLREVLTPLLETGEVELHTAYLDVIRFPSAEDDAEMATFLQSRNGEHPPHVVLTFGPQAAEFYRDRQDDLFPDARWLVGTSTLPSLQELGIADKVGGRLMQLSLVPFFKWLPRMLPDLRRLIVVTGAADFDRKWEAQAQEECRVLPEGITVEFWSGLPLGTLCERAAQLPADAAILYLTYFQAPDGDAWFPRDVAAQLAETASVPIFGPYDTYLGTGVTGGVVTGFRDLGADIAQQALAVRDHPDNAHATLLQSLPPRFRFDHRQLKRWGIDEGDLPADSEIRFSAPSLWETHRATLLVVAGLLLVQTALVIGLLLGRARQKRIQRDLRQSEQRFSGIFQSSPTAISLIRQSDGILLDVNPSWEQLFGHGRDEAIHHTPIELGILPDVSFEDLRNFFATGRGLQNFEQAIRTQTGESRWINLSCDRIQLAGEECYVVMAKDITDRHSLEEARESLAQASRLSLVGELTASIAHEINQPLAAILSNADAFFAALRSGKPLPPEQIQAIIEDIRRDDLRAAEVIRKVRNLLRHQRIERDPVDPAMLIREAMRLLRHDAARRGVQLECRLPQTLPSVLVDRQQIEQVLVNLVLNAFDALQITPVGSRSVIVAAVAMAERCEIKVQDTGPGIPADSRDRIFDSFHTTKPNGMGLGLALSRSIIQQHGGKLWLLPEKASGATFCFTLPLVSGHPDALFQR